MAVDEARKWGDDTATVPGIHVDRDHDVALDDHRDRGDNTSVLDNRTKGGGDDHRNDIVVLLLQLDLSAPAEEEYH
ncbi:hypothetical protein BGX24_008845 [Mortierella sp. AD032]|nr:hypothetical protein BGX24_008845 [Mortierella sp. AD032]